MNFNNAVFILLVVCFPFLGVAQKFETNGGIAFNLSLILGSQNQKVEAGITTIGTARFGDVAMETGLSFSVGKLFKRHTIKSSGFYYGYDFFYLGGIGKNDNLLGSSLFDNNTALIIAENRDGSFKGIGFGFEKEFLPLRLSHFNSRRGKILMRFSNANHSLDLTFTNDFRFGSIFNGQGTDFGSTGSLRLGYSQISSENKLYRTGLLLELFTPKPDYSKTPNNPINSDDGRKNVWYTQPLFGNVFYANIYAFGSYQEEHFSAFAKVGLNSQKLGAFVQNTLHDGVGLNPRFPWDVTAKDRFFYEFGASALKTSVYEN